MPGERTRHPSGAACVDALPARLSESPTDAALRLRLGLALYDQDQIHRAISRAGAECHLALYDRVVWNRLRKHLRGLAPGPHPPGLTVRRVLGEVAKGTRIVGDARFRIPEVVEEPVRYEARGWVERETLCSGLRSQVTP